MDYEDKAYSSEEKQSKGMDGAIQSIAAMARSIALEEIKDFSGSVRTMIRQELRALKAEIASDVAEEIARQIKGQGGTRR